jgi:hypothetical protein
MLASLSRRRHQKRIKIEASNIHNYRKISNLHTLKIVNAVTLTFA